MTILRELATRIAGQVCRFAPSGSKAWGEASARELDAIGNDWEAFVWALGSASVIWSGSRGAKPIGSLEDVPALARCVARQVRRRGVLCGAIAVVEAFVFLNGLQTLQGNLMKAACCLIVLSMAVFAIQGLLRRGRDVPKGLGLGAMAVALRAELVRQKEFHSGGWLAVRVYSLMPGFLLLCIGIWLSEPDLLNGLRAFGMGSAFAVCATLGARRQLRTAAAFQRQIDAIDDLKP